MSGGSTFLLPFLVATLAQPMVEDRIQADMNKAAARIIREDKGFGLVGAIGVR